MKTRVLVDCILELNEEEFRKKGYIINQNILKTLILLNDGEKLGEIDEIIEVKLHESKMRENND